MYIDRSLEHIIQKTGQSFKAVLVTGPRQVGKSTILRHLFSEKKYITLDDPTILLESKQEPGLFFKNNRPPILLDEIQYNTDLFPYIKMECDRTEEAGRFFLTGSQQYHLMQGVSESLAGRIAILELSGLSLRELQGNHFSTPFVPSEEYIRERQTSFSHVDDIWEIIHRGSYPALQNPDVDWQLFYGSYLQTYMERDINQLGKVQDKLKFTQFLTAMAARTGQMLNYSTVAEEVGVSLATIKNWTSLLETSGILYMLQPFSNSALHRATKTPKIYFRDTGLVCFLTKYQTPDTAKNGALAGNLFETFVVSEILKSYSNAGRDYRFSISYYRGKDKIRKKTDGETASKEAEIDLIIEENGTLYPVEIKLSANPKLSMTNAFDVLDKIPQKKRGTGAIICLYDEVLWLKDHIVALPVEFI
ncbi:MAG: ATP-binding protein [Lachnospiraceae bacterium]|nr:ATP-binding protein [Lachnospiraceae bacterium]